MSKVRHMGNQALREVEGYLELLIPPAPHLRLSREFRVPLAERALAVLNTLGESAHWSSQALLLRGQALRLLERYSEAIEPLRRAAQMSPGNKHIYLALGWCYKRCHRIDLAIESLEEALEAAPDCAMLYYNLACYWSLARNVKLAVSYLTRAFDLDPNYRDTVANEADFDPVRAHPHFQSLLTVAV